MWSIYCYIDIGNIVFDDFGGGVCGYFLGYFIEGVGEYVSKFCSFFIDDIYTGLLS